MKVTILGSGAAFICADRRSSSVLIETDDGQTVLVDCGWGVPASLAELHFPFHKLDHVCITHRHADHISALTNLVQTLAVMARRNPELVRPDAPVRWHGYPGFTQDFQTLVHLMTPEFDGDHDKNITEYPAGQPRRFGNLEITTTVVKHTSFFPSISFRFTEGNQVVAVSGDLGWDEAIIPIMQNADIALLECMILPQQYAEGGPRPGHLSPYECGQLAAKAGVKHLVLTHLNSTANPNDLVVDVRKNYQGQLTVSTDLQVFRTN